MTWCCEPKLLGGGMMTAGVALTQLIGNRVAWWVGLACLMLGPLLLSMKRRNINQKTKNE